MPESHESYEKLIEEYAKPDFALSFYVDAAQADCLIWKVRTREEVPRYVGEIVLTPKNYLHMNVMNESQKRQYIQDKVEPCFGKWRHELGLG